MSRCLAGDSARARVQRAARSPTAAVDTLGPDEGQRDCWTLEATLVEADAAGPNVYGALKNEHLDLWLAQSRGPQFVVVATA